MNVRQRENVAKYLYDMSKGVALLAVVGSLVQGKRDFWSLVLGTMGATLFFVSAYYLEKGNNHE